MYLSVPLHFKYRIIRKVPKINEINIFLKICTRFRNFGNNSFINKFLFIN